MRNLQRWKMLTCLFYTQLYGEGGFVSRDETCGCIQRTWRDWHSEYLASCTRSCSKMTRHFMVFRMNIERLYRLLHLVSFFDHSERHHRLPGGPELKESLFYIHFWTKNKKAAVAPDPCNPTDGNETCSTNTVNSARIMGLDLPLPMCTHSRAQPL